MNLNFRDDDQDHEDDVLTIDCPQCKQSMYEDADQCPSCGHFLMDSERKRQAPFWMVLLIAFLIITFVVGAFAM